MKKILVPFTNTHQFSTLIDEYLSGSETLQPFYRLAPEPGSFEVALRDRNSFSCDRQTLVARLIAQYGSLLSDGTVVNQKVSASIASLKKDNCFTVTTGHQLNIFTGPLYSIYKIATTIKLAQELTERYPANLFVPVFWMATEDHDFEEISSTEMFGKQVTWNRPASGAVGRLNLEGLPKVLEEVKAILGNEMECLNLFEDAYLRSATLAEATRKIIHGLFGEYGMVIIDGDDAALKRLFIPEMREDLFENRSFTSVISTNEQLSKIHKIQVQPRPINLFYLDESIRERIVKKEDDTFEVINTDLVFTKDDLLQELESHPEKFSPNVILRPLYQEKILPNLAYIGGPGELNYWLQFKAAFESSQIPFPVFILRNCMLLIEKSNASKMDKLGLSVPDLFMSSDYLILKVLENSSEVHIGTESIMAVVQKVYHDLGTQWQHLDASLVPAIEAEKQKSLKGILNLEEKARRAMKKKNESVVNQVKNLKEKLFPGGGLQERSDNFLPFYYRNPSTFLKNIIGQSNPFEKHFIVLIDE